MFTGIIEEVGTVQSIRKTPRLCTVTVKAHTVLQGTRIGDSISTDGVCLTVADLAPKTFSADVMPETLRRSSLGSAKSGTPVNLERALAADGRFGGHIVSGHIDGTGMIKSITEDGNALWYEIEAPREIARLVVAKGSIAIDGISLTVAEARGRTFSVSVIPHTREHTSLAAKKAGSVVNLENDIVGKYVERLVSEAGPAREGSLSEGGFQHAPSGGDAVSAGITRDFLELHGF